MENENDAPTPNMEKAEEEYGYMNTDYTKDIITNLEGSSDLLLIPGTSRPDTFLVRHIQQLMCVALQDEIPTGVRRTRTQFLLLPLGGARRLRTVTGGASGTAPKAVGIAVVRRARRASGSFRAIVRTSRQPWKWNP